MKLASCKLILSCIFPAIGVGGDLRREAGVGTSRKVDYTSMFLAMASRMPEPPDFRELLLLPESND
jgi:hypothetical protein